MGRSCSGLMGRQQAGAASSSASVADADLVEAEAEAVADADSVDAEAEAVVTVIGVAGSSMHRKSHSRCNDLYLWT